MIVTIPLHPILVVDTVAKTATLTLQVPAADGEGDVTVFSQNVTAQLSVDDRRRLRHLLNATASQ